MNSTIYTCTNIRKYAQNPLYNRETTKGTYTSNKNKYQLRLLHYDISWRTKLDISLFFYCRQYSGTQMKLDLMRCLVQITAMFLPVQCLYPKIVL